MDLFLAILGWTGFGLVIVGGLLLDLVGLFGNWLILGAVGVAWAVSGFEHFGGWCMVLLAGGAVLGEVIEAVAAGYGAARFGGGKGAALAAVVGCLVGAVAGTPWFPIVGTLIGACAGAFVGATSYEYLVGMKDSQAAFQTGLGAALGKVAGMLAKLLIGFVMLLAAALMY